MEGCLGRSRNWGLKSPQGHSQVIPYSLDSPAADQPIPGPEDSSCPPVGPAKPRDSPPFWQLPPMMDAAAQLYLLGDMDCTAPNYLLEQGLGAGLYNGSPLLHWGSGCHPELELGLEAGIP